MSGKRKHSFTKEQLYKLYWTEKLSCTEIASKFKAKRGAIERYLQYFDIPLRSLSERIQLAYDKGILDKKGAKSSKWKGGRSIDKRGYISVYIPPTDPLHIMCRQNRNSIDEHRLIMAKHLGRPLMTYELVHHINGVKGDNRIENLLLYSASEHQQIERNCRGCPMKKEIKRLNNIIRELKNTVQCKFSH